MLGIVRTYAACQLTGLFNLGDAALTLTVTGKASSAGPQNGTVDAGLVTLPAHGYVFLASTGPLSLSVNH